MTDLEKQGLSTAHAAEQYGAIESDPKKLLKDDADKLPLLLGRWAVSPDQLYRVALGVYVVWFVVHRLADVAYILTVDARFPSGLGHLYPSEAQRLESVSYTRQVLLCGMLHRCLVFGVVFSIVYFQLFGRFDAWLRAGAAAVGAWWADNAVRRCIGRSCDCCCSPVWRCCSVCCSPIGRCLWFIFGRPCTWCWNFKERVLYGKLSMDIQSRWGFRLGWRELLHGSVYLAIFGAFFFLLSAPFMYWMQSIDLKFGFANSLTVSLSNFRKQFILGFFSVLIWGIPQKFVFLAVLQYRLGWVFMWAGLIISIVYAQYNVSMIAPMLGMNLKFPSGDFAVGRGFPLVQTGIKQVPWISLNRLFFPDPYAVNHDQLNTNDKSKGPLSLSHEPSGKWAITDFHPGNVLTAASANIYAQTVSPASKALMEGLSEQSWTVGGPETRMGVRSGKELRDKLFGFAHNRQIGIGQIYMVDGSHKDARANAFVTGAGNHSIIGLYDTLFLGERGSDAQEDDSEDAVQTVADDHALIQHVSEVVQGVDPEEKELRPPRNSAPTQAMTDDEIVSILAHELAHSALKHMEQGMAAQVVTSFVTFATLGWMASSPLSAAALSLSAPLLHVGSCAYDHLVGPPLEGFMKLFTDGLTRHNEYEADGYAAMISEKYGTALQTSLAKLSVNSNQDPDVPFFYEWLHADHPTFAKRWAHIEKVKEQAYGKTSKP